MEEFDVDGIFQHYRLNPTEVEAVTYYLPRLLSGETLHGVEKLIHNVEISGCEPKDLAARYAPVPQAAGSGDRFFFTTCKSKNGSKLQSVRSAGGGTWTIQKTTEISHAGAKVGEVKNLSFKKKGKSTGWVMEEYRCLLPEATVAEGVKVFCKMHLAQHAPAPARQESAAYKLQEPQPEAVTAQRRPAPAAASDPHPPRPNKRMRGAVPVPVPAPATPSFTDAAPVFLPDESIPEADDDMGQFSCSMKELLGLQVDGELQFDEAAAEQERQAISTNEKSSMVQDVGTYKPPAIFSHPSEAEWQADEALGKDGEAYGFDVEELERMMEADEALRKEMRYNAAPDGEADGFDIEELERMMDQHEPLYLDALDQGMLQSDNSAFHDAEKEDMLQSASDLDAPSLQGHDHLFQSQSSSFDPFEAAWKAEEALENEKRNNVVANLLGGHNNFFSSASVR
ncbi:hypothetical protein ZWY2020_048734 [Hordeum vulgare]|nr:hypothetical protein ZWY2020_048734 [Hordeum vulgare]